MICLKARQIRLNPGHVLLHKNKEPNIDVCMFLTLNILKKMRPNTNTLYLSGKWATYMISLDAILPFYINLEGTIYIKKQF